MHDSVKGLCNSPRASGAKRVAKGVRYGIIELSPRKVPSLRRRGEGLPGGLVVRSGIGTLEKRLVGRRLGALKAGDWTRVQAVIQRLWSPFGKGARVDTSV